MSNLFKNIISRFTSKRDTTPSPQEKLACFLKERNIEILTHFTLLENLDTIFHWGLLSRNELAKRNIPFSFNDLERHEGQLDAICCSVSFPNYKNFYYKRCNDPRDMCVLVIDANVLLSSQFKSSWYNAAKGNGCYICNGVEGFMDLFSERPGHPNRDKLGIPNHYPTNPQAEVLILHEVNLSYIKKVIFQKEEDAWKHLERVVGVEFVCDKNHDFFHARIDYSYW